MKSVCRWAMAGVITPFGTFGWLKGSNLTPDQNTLKLMAQFYNRPDTPVPLRGSANDAPLSSITPLRTINGVRFDSRSAAGLVNMRYAIRREWSGPIRWIFRRRSRLSLARLRSLNSFAVQTLRGGYTVRKEKHR